MIKGKLDKAQAEALIRDYWEWVLERAGKMEEQRRGWSPDHRANWNGGGPEATKLHATENSTE